MDNRHLNDIELYEYESGALPTAERARAEDHIASCAECRSLLALAQAGADALQSAPRFELPADALERTLGSLGRQEAELAAVRGGFSMRRALAFLAPVAAIAGVVIVVVFAARGGDDSASESAAPAPASEPAPAAPDPAPAEPSARQLERATDAAAAEPEALADSVDAAELEEAPAPAEAAPAQAAPAEDPAPAPPPGPAPEPAPAPAGAPPAAEPAAPADADPETVVDPTTRTSDAEPPLALVSGPAAEIVTLLGDAGINAVLAPDGNVEIAEADAGAATELLATRPAGNVAIRVALEPAP